MVNNYYGYIFTGATIVPFESFNYIYFPFWLCIRYDTVAWKRCFVIGQNYLILFPYLVKLAPKTVSRDWSEFI